MHAFRLVLSSALACLAVLLIGGMLSASAHDQQVLSQALSNADRKAPPTATAMTSTPVSGTLDFFEVYTYSMAPYGSDSHVTADFDRDGRPDVIIAETLRSALTGRLVLLHNLGNSQFAATTLITYPAAYLYKIMAADLNHDQWPDLVLRRNCDILVLLNDHTGGFTTSWIAADGYQYCGFELALADMTGDNAIDILAGEQANGGGRIDLFVNNGAGTVFTRTWQSPLLGEPNAGAFNNIVPARLNSDSAPDIVASEIYNALLVTFIGDGTGITFTQVMSSDVGERTYGMAGGHLNGDSLTDVVLNTDGVLRAYTAQGGGMYSETWTGPSIGSGSVHALRDFDGDGYDDLFSSSFGSGQMYMYLNQPSSHSFQLAWTGKLPSEIYSGTVDDMDGDGNLDLIVGEDSVLHIYRSVFLTKHFFLPMVFRNLGAVGRTVLSPDSRR